MRTALPRKARRRLLDAARKSGERLHTLYVVALHCGLREGEMLGLKWDDVDFGRGVLHVSRTLSETRTGHKFE